MYSCDVWKFSQYFLVSLSVLKKNHSARKFPLKLLTWGKSTKPFGFNSKLIMEWNFVFYTTEIKVLHSNVLSYSIQNTSLLDLPSCNSACPGAKITCLGPVVQFTIQALWSVCNFFHTIHFLILTELHLYVHSNIRFFAYKYMYSVIFWPGLFWSVEAVQDAILLLLFWDCWISSSNFA